MPPPPAAEPPPPPIPPGPVAAPVPAAGELPETNGSSAGAEVMGQTEFPVQDWNAWRPQVRATLLFIVQGGRILLIRKKRGLGAGKVNGPGGKIDPGETPVQCAIRETREELCVQATGVREAGRLWFQFADGFSLFCHVFRGDGCTGVAQETDEAIPLWTPVEHIPYAEMWADDLHWLPLLLEGKLFQGRFDFDGDSMITRRVEIVEALAAGPVFRWRV